MTTTFLTVLQSAATLAGLGDITRQVQAAADLTGYLNQEVRSAWEIVWWPRITLTQQRRYRAPWAGGTTYGAPAATAPVEVFHYGSVKYAQALVASTGQAPFSYANSTWNINGAYWAECAFSYSGNDWAAGTAYVIGAAGVSPGIVRNPADNRWYACHTAHTSGATFDSTKFGILTALRPYVAADQSWESTVIGHVRWLSRHNPEVRPDYIGVLDFRQSELGYEVRASDFVPEPFVTFRRERPVFTVTPWSAATAYVVGNLVYSSTTGQSYKSVLAGTNHAVTDTAYWEVVTFPEWLADPVATAVAARVLNDQKQTSRARAVAQMAADQLDDIKIRELPAQEQAPRARVNLGR